RRRTAMSDDMANVSLADPRVQACPYQAYEHMREHGPVYRDPLTGTYVVTSYKVLRQVLLDDETFRRQGKSKVVMNPEKQARIDEEFRTKGWIPGPSLGGYDEPEHARVRAVFNDWFRAKRMRELDPFVQQ